MRRTMLVTSVAAAAALTVGVIAATAGTGSTLATAGSYRSRRPRRSSRRPTCASRSNLLGEHAVLAMNATNPGVTGSKSFPAAAKALDHNSVELSQAIGSIYGAKAGNTFFDGPFMWRAHVRFFVDYTVAPRSRQGRPGQAVANLQTYTVRFGDFLAGATGLPKPAVRNDLLGHVLELKGQLDAFAAGIREGRDVPGHTATCS